MNLTAQPKTCSTLSLGKEWNTGFRETNIILVLKMIVILLLIGSLQARATGYAQTISISGKDLSLKKVFNTIKKQCDYSFFYSDSDLRDAHKVSIHMQDAALETVLNEVFSAQPLTYSIIGKTIVVKKNPLRKKLGLTEKLYASVIEIEMEKVITGKVSDADGTALQGVSVTVRGSAAGTTTDQNGAYSLTVGDNARILVFSMVGYLSVEKEIGNNSVLNVTLERHMGDLGEVVVLGYGTQIKKDLTGAVATVSPKQYDMQPVTRLDQVLQGRAAGVEVTNATGAPGGDVRIRIRGSNSILGDNNPLYVVDGFVGADFSTINPENIASIQVLKDASSTAIYGSRGANGVIIVTTQKGKSGAVNVSYSGKLSLSSILKTYDVLPAAEFAEVVNARNLATGLNPTFTPDQISQYKQNGGTDWQDAVYREAFGQEHELSVSGGGDRTTFFVSGNYLNQEGVIKASSFRRYNLRSNISSHITDKLTFNLNVAVNNRINKNTGILSGTSNPGVQAVAWAPTTPIYQPDGSLTLRDPVGSIFFNPVALMFNRENIVQNTYENVIANARYEIIDGLALDLTFVANHLNQGVRNFNDGSVANGNPNASQSSLESLTTQETGTLSYKRKFGDSHSLDAVAVIETQKYQDRSFNASASGLLIPDLGYNNLGLSGAQQVSSGLGSWSLLSYLGRVNYSFQDKYLFTASVRRDGSSRFQGANRNSIFPAFALGWNLGQEDFFKDIDIFSNFKIRASWGQTGSQAIQPFATQSTYGTVIVSFDNNDLTSGIILGNPGNSNLRWETTNQSDIGLEFGILDGRINIETDYFIKHTSNLLMNRPLPGYVGGGSLASNVGKTENKGWEFSIGGDIIRNASFTWTSQFNFANMHNKVVSIGDIGDKLFTGANVGAGTSTQSEFVIVPGQPLGSYWGLNYLGTWKPGEADKAAQFGAVPGDSKYEDLDDDHLITANDYQIIGYGMPKTFLGWNNTLTYKAFSLNFFFQGVTGVDKMNLTLAAMLMGTGDARQITSTEIQNRYIPGQNETSDIQGFSSSTQNFTQSTQFLENGSFIRLKNLSLSYDLPVSILSRSSNLRIMLAGTNVLTFTKYKGMDPEASNIGSGTDTNQSIDYGAYPNSKSIILGVKLSF